MARRSRPEIVRAVYRLKLEPAEPLATLAPSMGVPRVVAERWVMAGLAGVYLDGVHHPQLGWLSSWPAYLRFCRELAE